MKRVGIVEGEHQNGGLAELVVTGGDAGHALHTACVPQLEFETSSAGGGGTVSEISLMTIFDFDAFFLPSTQIEYLAVVIQAQCG